MFGDSFCYDLDSCHPYSAVRYGTRFSIILYFNVQSKTPVIRLEVQLYSIQYRTVPQSDSKTKDQQK